MKPRWEHPMQLKADFRVPVDPWQARDLALHRDHLLAEGQHMPFEDWHEIVGGPPAEARYGWIIDRQMVYVGTGRASHVLLFVYPVHPPAEAGEWFAVTPSVGLPEKLRFTLPLAEQRAFDKGTHAFEIVYASITEAPDMAALERWAGMWFPIYEAAFWREHLRWVTQPQGRDAGKEIIQ